ncbi:response regulator transcription factor [Enterobacter cloacae]|uniref:response regulator transcription factor n=1 Tax=Enterobacter cloacae TaxID=550 RepID=UPI0034A4357B
MKIAIIDRQPLILQGLSQLLIQEPEYHLTHCCRGAQELAQRLTREPVDIVIAEDHILLQEFRDDASQLLMGYLRQGKLIITTDLPPPYILSNLLEVGGRVLISKHDPQEEILKGLRFARDTPEKNYFSPTLYSLLERITLSRINSQELTQKEIEVVKLLASGIPMVHIAKIKNRSISTVATHKYNAMRKLGISTNAELIRHAIDYYIS